MRGRYGPDETENVAGEKGRRALALEVPVPLSVWDGENPFGRNLVDPELPLTNPSPSRLLLASDSIQHVLQNNALFWVSLETTNSVKFVIVNVTHKVFRVIVESSCCGQTMELSSC
jgi:hypothetical protein